jgi:hypothetical protein
MEYEVRDFVANGFVPAEIPWAGGGLDCSMGPLEAGINVRSGVDSAQVARAGGEMRREELTAYARRRLAWGWEGEATLFLAHNRDRDGFSVLLDNGARREVDRRGYRISVSRPLGGQNSPWILQLDYERAADESNLSLFDRQDEVVLLGLRHTFQ